MFNEHDRIPALILLCITLIILSIITAVIINNWQENNLIQESVQRGSDPIKAACAFTSDNATRLYCIDAIK